MRRLLLVLAATVLAVTALAAIPSARADISYSQQVVLRNDPGPYYRTYTSFRDGAKSCSTPPGPCGWPYSIAKGKLTIMPRTYKLKEQNKRYDYYVVDLSVRTSDRSGAKDWAFLEATVQSTRDVNYATYSLGKSKVDDDCKTYPIEIAGGWGPLSVGTTVGSFKVGCVETWISRKAVTRGQFYHLTNLNGVTSVTFQRFVRVAAGVKPSFKLTLVYPTDACGKTSASNGSTTVLYKWCTNRRATWTKTVGTTG